MENIVESFNDSVSRYEIAHKTFNTTLIPWAKLRDSLAKVAGLDVDRILGIRVNQQGVEVVFKR